MTENVSDLDIYTSSNPRSIVNLVTETLRERIVSLPEELVALSEHKLRLKVQPDFVTSQLRMAFWIEYHRVQVNNLPRMRTENIYGAICDHSTWGLRVITDPERLAWILCPPNDWLMSMRAILNDGAELMWKLVQEAHIELAGGYLDQKKITYLMRIIENANVIVHGAPVMRSETKSLNVHVNQEQTALPKTVAEIEKELRKLRELAPSPLEPIASIDMRASSPEVVTVHSTRRESLDE